MQQQNKDDINQFDFEKSLRDDKDSFNTVRKLCPTRFRYRILDANNQVVSGRSTDATQVDANRTADHRCDSSNIEPTEYTHVDFADFLREVAA